jgi:hypothetical protein
VFWSFMLGVACRIFTLVIVRLLVLPSCMPAKLFK